MQAQLASPLARTAEATYCFAMHVRSPNRALLVATTLAALAGAHALAACSDGSSSDRGSFQEPTRGDDGGATVPPPDDDDTNGDFVTNDAAAPGDCSSSNKLVYTIDQGDGFDEIGTLRRFDPTTATFSTIGRVECDNFFGPNSMAVARDGTAWVLYGDGSLFKVSTDDASCTPTSFEPNQVDGLGIFGMGFASNGAGSAQETLYIAGDPDTDFEDGRAKFGSIDLGTLKVTEIGSLGLDTRAEFTGTGEGRLFGAFEGSPWIVAEVEKSTGKTLSQAPQKNINGESNFAFAAWGGDFYLFVGLDVFRYHPGDAASTKVASVNFRIVGAGVSTCAPYMPPN